MKRLAAGETLAYGREHLRIGPHLGMTTHAGVGGRDAGEEGFFDRIMAIAAINAEARDVVLMTEGNRLDQRHVLIRRIRRHINRVTHPPKCEKTDDHGSESPPRN